MLDQSKTLATVLAYLAAVNREIQEDETATHANLHAFAEEVAHNSDMTKNSVMDAIGNFEHFTVNAIAHIEGVLGASLGTTVAQQNAGTTEGEPEATQDDEAADTESAGDDGDSTDMPEMSDAPESDEGPEASEQEASDESVDAADGTTETVAE